MLSEKVVFPEEPISILDYCCGVGYVGMEIKRVNDSLFGIDINPHAILTAKLNSSLQNRKNVKFMCKTMLPRKHFDLIACNPPYVFLSQKESHKIDSYGGKYYGLDLTIKLLGNLFDFLAVNGQLFMLTSSPVMNNEVLLLKILEQNFPNLCGECFHLSDSIFGVSKRERNLNIQGYQHILIKVSKRLGKQRLGWVNHFLRGSEKFKYAF